MTPNHARGCVISRRDAQNGPERTIETPSAKIKTIYRSSSCVRIFASGLFTQPRAAANGGIASRLQSARRVAAVAELGSLDPKRIVIC
jgi:hypothetical protein